MDQSGVGKVALITGATGQDGAYLAEFLLEKGYTVHGLKRRSSSFNTGRVEHLYQDPHEPNQQFILHFGDMTDSTNLIRIVQETQPDEIYNLAAQSHVQVSFETAEYTANADALGTLRLLEAIRLLGLVKKTRFYQASTSELYGKVQEIPQTENDAVLPAQPLRRRQALRPLDGRELPRSLRDARLERHPVQSREPAPRRDLRHPQDHARRRRDRKRAAGAALSRQSRRRARLGPCARICARHVADAAAAGARRLRARHRRAPLRAHASWRRRFGRPASRSPGTERASARKGWTQARAASLSRSIPRYFRPTEVDILVGDPSKAREKLGWKHETNLDALCAEMVREDMAAIADGKARDGR